MVTDECGRPIKQEVEYFGDEYTHDSEEKFDALEGITSKNEFGQEQIKSDVIDIVYHDVKSERCLEEVKGGLHCEECGGRLLSSTDFFSTDNLQSCNCHARTGDDMTRDLKSLDFVADSGTFFHDTQNETVVGKEEEVTTKNISSTPHGKLFGIKTVDYFEHGQKINEFSSEKYLNSVRDSSFHEEYENCSKNLKKGKYANLVENKYTEKLPVSSIESSISKKHIDSKPFQCKFCSKLCYDSSHLTRHVRIHTGERPFQCKICSKSFIQKSDLKSHVRIHTGIKPSQCKICSKSFISGGNLRRHEKIHTGKKPFQCKICSKSFNQNGHLKTHEKIHTGERPFQCKICSKSFHQFGHLKTHEKIHTGERPFQCKICSKSFRHCSTLKTHEKIHTGERPFQCKICSKSFIRRGHLKTHENIHTGEKPFQCNICFKSFSRNIYLRIHEQKHIDKKPV